MHEDELHAVANFKRDVVLDIFAVSRGENNLSDLCAVGAQNLAESERKQGGNLRLERKCTFSLIPPTGVTRPRRVT